MDLIIPDKSLVQEMDVAAPRYTSYPTIPVWTEAASQVRFVERLQRHTPERELTLYFHVPFCHSICHYCGCNTSKLERQEQVDRYIDALEREIGRMSGHLDGRHTVQQIHWGGGTPTVLTSEQFDRVFESLGEKFELEPHAEIAIETNPMTCQDDKLQYLLDKGFNRISIGVQDFDEEVQKLIGRHQTIKRTREFCRLIRQSGVKSLNFDLVYGLPGQTLEGLKKTLDTVVELLPDRIAVYSFAFLPAMRDNQKLINPDTVPGADSKFDLYLETISNLQKAGYRMIGMDHFARVDDELVKAHEDNSLRRNFMGYTTKAHTDVLAMGVSSISDFSDYYCQTEKDIAAYEKAQKIGELPVMRQCELDADDGIRRRTIMDLLCNGQIDRAEIGIEYGIDFDSYFQLELEKLEPLVKKDIVVIGDEIIEATALGRYFLRNIALHFDNYFDGRKGPKTDTTYSKTV